MVRSLRNSRRDLRWALSCMHILRIHLSLTLTHTKKIFLCINYIIIIQWFATYNLLSHSLPPPSPAHPLLTKLLRQAFIGFAASVVSDTASNSLRVLKTYRQVNATNISYTAAAKRVLAADGWKGLFGRGLKTRILANGCQGLMFSVLWKMFLDL